MLSMLDRLLELEHRTLNHITSESNSFLKPNEEQEYQSLKSQIEKAIEFQDEYMSPDFHQVRNDILENLKQNQKSPQDIEDLKLLDELMVQLKRVTELSGIALANKIKKNQEIVDRLKEEIKILNETDIHDTYHVYEVESLLEKILDGGEK